jgi:hypothetical protein
MNAEQFDEHWRMLDRIRHELTGIRRAVWLIAWLLFGSIVAILLAIGVHG